MTLGLAFTALGYLTGALVFFWAAREKGVATDGMGRLAAIGFFGGILGAKLTQLLFEGWPWRVPAATILDPSVGGRALLGGLVVGWVCVEVAKRRLGIQRSTGDLFALALPAGEAVGRIGCYFNGCCYGSECELPWAVWQHDAFRHPAQLYSAVVAGGIFFALAAVRKTVSPGELFRWYLLLFGVTRFALEFLRYRESLWWGLSPMQWFCIELAAFAGLSLTFSARKRKIGVRIDPTRTSS